MKILHVNASDVDGGAARGAYRVHQALHNHGGALGLQSRMRVLHKQTDDVTVLGGPPVSQSRLWRHLHPSITPWLLRGFHTENPSLHSLSWATTGLGAELESRRKQGTDDVLHLHWLGENTLSIEEIGRLPGPVVWTLHDQWPFCGAEHYTNPPRHGESHSTDERFVVGYTPRSRLPHERGPDVNRRTWLRKQKCWRRVMHIICCSTWMGECARRSMLMHRWPISVIPYPIDATTWAPFAKDQARLLLDLPRDRQLILFGAVGGTCDPRKGADLLMSAIRHLARDRRDDALQRVELLVFGQSRPAEPPDMGFPIHYMGRVTDDLKLRLLYAAADVMVVPSRQEAFGLTAAEAYACATPVVAFRTGGLIDIVDDRVTGALAEPFDPESLASAIRWVIEDPERRARLGSAARVRAVSLWDPARISGLYAAVYQQAMREAQESSR